MRNYSAALMTTDVTDLFAYPHRHLLGIEGLYPHEISYLLDRSETYVDQNRHADKKKSTLRGRTIINLFFENSTRTRTSFELAGKRLGADVINMSVASSSIKKGETMLDTAMTLNAMHPDVLVVRHPDSGAAQLLSEKVNCAVVSGGDGSHEHPTQALLGRPDHSPPPGRPGSAANRHLRRCAAFSGRTVKYPSAEHHGCAGSSDRAADAYPNGDRTNGRRGLP